MAALDTAIVQQIKNDAILAPLLLRSGSDYHIYPDAIPTNFLEEGDTDAAYLVYNEINTFYKQRFAYMMTTIQFSIFAHKKSKAVAVREALLDVFHRFQAGTLGSGSNTRKVEFVWAKSSNSLKDKDSEMYMVTVDCAFKHREE